MTALAGLVCFDGQPAAPRLEAMLAAQRAYGPDDSGRWADGDVALGRQLMRTLPEDRFDRQPLIGGDGRFALVADVRLDDRAGLAADLQIEHERARQMSDADFVLAAFERWGQDCFGRLYGDYAVAIWDGAQRSWMLARDPMGGRPLHYYRGDRFLAFASMPKGLHALPETPYEADTELLARALENIFPDPGASCFRHIARVPMGVCMLLSQGGEQSHRHWSPSRQVLKLKRPQDYHAAMREQLDRAVLARLRGAQDVATHLSSGLDSSAVSATAARLQAKAGRGVVAFTSTPRRDFDGVSPPGRIVDEGPIAADVAAMYDNMEHVRVRTDGRSPLDGLDRAFHLYEQPIASLANATWGDAINDAIRDRGLKVLLTGQMGNFTISYDGRHGPSTWLARGAWLTLAREALAMVRAGRSWRGVAAQAVQPHMPERLWAALLAPSRLRDSALTSLLDPALRAQLGLSRVDRPRYIAVNRADSHADRIYALQRADGSPYAKGILAHWRIDQRDPTADRRLVEFCLSVPDAQFLHKGVPSAMARVGLADRLPRSVLESRGKGLQSAGWQAGLTQAHDRLVEEVDRIAQSTQAARLLDLPRLKRLVDDWPSEGWDRDEVQTEYKGALLRALAFGHFLRRAERSNG